MTSTSTSHSCSLAAQVQASTIAPIVSLARSSSRLRASPSIRQWPGTTLEAVPPAITPTLAVVSSSSRPSSIAAIAAAAASIALRPSSGRIPACASVPSNSASQPLVGRRRGDHLADRARVVEHEAERRAQRPEVELLRSPQPVLLGDREHELEPDRRPGSAAWRAASSTSTVDRGLVVGAEDRLAAAAKDALVEHDLDRAVVRDRVEVGRRTSPTRRARPGPGRSGCRRPRAPARPRRPPPPRRRARAARRAPRRPPPAPRRSGSGSRRAGRSDRAFAGRRPRPKAMRSRHLR